LSQLHHLESTLASHRHSPFRSLSPPSSPTLSDSNLYSTPPSNSPSPHILARRSISPTTAEEDYTSSSPIPSRSHSRRSNRARRYSPYQRPQTLEETVERLAHTTQELVNRLTNLEHLVERLSEPAPSPPSYSTPQATVSSPSQSSYPSRTRTPSPRGLPPPIARTAGPLSPSQRRQEPQTHNRVEVWHHVFEGQTETYTHQILASSIRIYRRPNGEIHRVDVREHRH